MKVFMFLDNAAGHMRFDGTCDQHIIEDEVQDGVEVSHAACSDICAGLESCVGFSFSYEGCYPHSSSCVGSLTVKDTGGWYYHSGPGTYSYLARVSTANNYSIPYHKHS